MKKIILASFLFSSLISINAMADTAQHIADKALLNQQPSHVVMIGTNGQKIDVKRSIDDKGIVTTTITNIENIK
jgi:hypothetical protein